MGKTKVGLIGLGIMGTPHAKTSKRMEEFDLVAASDVDEKQKEITDAPGIKFYRHYEEMIEKEPLEGVILAVPNHLHTPIDIACAQRGLHLLIEKPIAQSVSEADRLIEMANKNKVRILVGHQRRFSSRVGVTVT